MCGADLHQVLNFTLKILEKVEFENRLFHGLMQDVGYKNQTSSQIYYIHIDRG